MGFYVFSAVALILPSGDFNGVCFYRRDNVGFKFPVIFRFKLLAVILVVGDKGAEKIVMFFLKRFRIVITTALFLAVKVIN